MHKNSNRPNRVITAVFGMSYCGSTGIWRTRSILEVLVPLREMEKSCMCGMGYLSGTEAWLSA